MQEKKKQYILDNLLRIILAMFVLTVLFAFWVGFFCVAVCGSFKKTNRSCSSMPQVIPSQTYVTWNVISVREPRWR